MKRAERHHLKDNELAHLTANAREAIASKQGPIAGILIAIVAVLLGAGGYLTWRNRVESRAHAQLAAALAVEEARVGAPAAFGTQPSSGLSFVSQREKDQAALTKFKEVADAFPSSDAGIYARYRQGTTYMALGAPKSAVEVFQQVIGQGGKTVYADMARLGLAEAQAQNGDYESAISTFRELSQHKDGQLPVDGLLMRLGRTQAEAGKAGDAQQTFSRLVEEFPESPFTADAKKELDQLRKSS